MAEWAVSVSFQAGENSLGRAVVGVVRHSVGGSSLYLRGGIPHSDGTAHRTEHFQVICAVAHSGTAFQWDAPHQGEEGQSAALVYSGGDQLEIMVVGGGEGHAGQGGQLLQRVAARLLIPVELGEGQAALRQMGQRVRNVNGVAVKDREGIGAPERTAGEGIQQDLLPGEDHQLDVPVQA